MSSDVQHHRRQVRHKVKTGLLKTVEALFALGIVALFFSVFLGIYVLSFPEGTPLQDVVNFIGPGYAMPQNQRLDMGEFGSDTATFNAQLARVRRTVKDKPAGAIVWNDSRPGITLGDRHAIQTMSASGATIAFDASSRLRLDENSLVVIRDAKLYRRSRERSATVVLLEGDFRGRLETSNEGPLEVEINSSGSSMRVASRAGQPADFRVTSRGDETTTYAVYEGVAEVTVGEETVEMSANDALTVDTTGNIVARTFVPAAPVLNRPEDGAAFVFRTTPPLVRFQWDGVEPLGNYRFELARDAECADIVHQEIHHDNRLTHRDLDAGHYYWRVVRLLDGVESEPSDTRAFEVVHDREPPSLVVEFPDGTVSSRTARLTGRTDPGARVVVAGVEAAVMDDGRFEIELSLDPGINTIVVEAIDPANNVTYQSELIHAKFGDQGRAP